MMPINVTAADLERIAETLGPVEDPHRRQAMDDRKPLLPCPFCGAKQGRDGPVLYETHRQDHSVRNKRGNLIKRVSIVQRVECTTCGAAAPDTYLPHEWGSAAELTPEMITYSEDAAVLAWNTRQPIHDRAFALVNRLITDTLATLDREK